jgi:hypothetical protein
LIPLVYEELRRVAHYHLQAQRDGHTLQSTALVNEVYLRLMKQEPRLENRAHFFAVASRLMRQILVDYAREPVPGPGGRWQISTIGGEQPRWVRNGKEIVYRNGTKMMSAAVQIQPSFAAAKPVELFDRKFDRGGSVSGYDVTPDGQTFVMTRAEQANPTEIRVVVGWSAGQQAQK